MSVTHTARAVFSSVHKFVFAVLLVTLLRSAMPSPTTRQAGVRVSVACTLDVSQRSRRSDTKSGHVNGLQRPALCFQSQCRLVTILHASVRETE